MDALTCCPFCCLKVHYFSEIHLFYETVNFSKYNPKILKSKFFHTFYETVNFLKQRCFCCLRVHYFSEIHYVSENIGFQQLGSDVFCDFWCLKVGYDIILYIQHFFNKSIPNPSFIKEGRLDLFPLDKGGCPKDRGIYHSEERSDEESRKFICLSWIFRYAQDDNEKCSGFFG